MLFICLVLWKDEEQLKYLILERLGIETFWNPVTHRYINLNTAQTLELKAESSTLKNQWQLDLLDKSIKKINMNVRNSFEIWWH